MKTKIKNLVILTLSFLSGSLVGQEQPFTIKGKFIETPLAEKVFIQYSYNSGMVKDSAIIANNQFVFNGNIDGPLKVYFRVPTFDRAVSSTDFFIEPNQTTTIEIVNNPKNATISGGQIQQDYAELTKRQAPHEEKFQAILKDYLKLREAKDEAGMNKLEPMMDEALDNKKQVLNAFIQEKPDSYISFTSLLDVSHMIDEKFINMYDRLGSKYKSTKKAKDLEAQIEKSKKSFVGEPVMPFTQKDTSGVDFSISQLKGKFVLIDFWASWCGPCRKENPNLVKAYKNFKDKNFEILGVSLDSKRDAWITAIHKDELHWYHVSDLKGWKNEVSEMFGIRAIPQNLLIDPNGKILARNVTGEDLVAALSKHLAGL